MKKFILVVFIGLVLTFDVCGLVKELMTDDEEVVNHIAETTTTVYVE